MLHPASWPAIADAGESAQAQVERSDMLQALRRAVEDALTPRQCEVFVALALNHVPIDVLAGRLDTTRGALYKAPHDARSKLRRELAPHIDSQEDVPDPESP